MTLISGYNMNMFGNPLMGMLNGSSLGGIFGGGFGGCGIFTNCFGEVNYDAMAGYGVANALLGVAGQAINHTVSEKREKKAEYQENKAEIERITQDIEDKTGEKAGLEAENKTKQGEITTAETTIRDLEGQITELKVEEKKKAYEDANAQDPKPANLADLEKVYNDAVAEEKRLNEEITKQENIKEEANKTIEENNQKINELTEDIKNLKKELNKLQASVNEIDLDRADGKKFQRTKKEDFDAKWNDDGSMADNAEFTKGDMRYAIAGFRNATSDEDKKYWANKIATIYKNMNQSDITSDFKAARKIVDSYVD